MDLFYLTHYIYLSLFVLSVVEGPITSFVASGFAAQGVLNFWYVAGIVLLGDVVADIGFYFIGRSYHKIPFLQKFSQFSAKKRFLSKLLEKRPLLFLLIVKITPYLAIPSLIFTGVKKMPIWRFVLYSTLISLVVKAVYLTLGFVGSFSVGQMKGFLHSRQQIVLYVVVGVLLLWGIRCLYVFVLSSLKKSLPKE